MMGRSPSSDDKGLKKGPWTPDEDRKLAEFIQQHGHGSWRALPKLAGLNRCGKSCRLRWTNYLRPDIKRGKFSEDEEQTIINLHSLLGNKWSAIAGHLEGRTDNEIKNFWNTHLKKKLLNMGIDPVTHKPRTDLNLLANLPQLLLAADLLTTTATSPTNSVPPILLNHMLMNPPLSSDNNLSLQYSDHQLAKIHALRNILQVLTTNNSNTASTSSASTNLPSVAHDQDNNCNTADIIANTTTSPIPHLPGLIMPFHHQNNQLQYDDRFPCNFSNFEPPPASSQQNMNAHFDKDTVMMMMPPPASSNNTINPQQNIPSTSNQHHQTTLITQPIAASNNRTSSSTHVPITCSTIEYGTRDDDQMPSLVPASPDQQRMKLQMDEESKFNTNLTYDENISNPSSTKTTTFDAWNKIIDDEASNSYWKDIVQQAELPSWPISSYVHSRETRHFGA